MEKCDGVPEIVRFRNILDDNCVPWIWNKSKIVICMYGMIFEISQATYHCEKPLSIAMYSPAVMISSMMEGFTADEIIPYIDKRIGGQ
jgi:hypothetical protein